MSVPTMKQLSLRVISINMPRIQNYLCTQKIQVPISISEQIWNCLIEATHEMGEKEITSFSKIDFQFRNVTINAKKIKDLSCLQFLKNHPIEKFEICYLREEQSLENILGCLNLDELKTFRMSPIKNSFKFNRNTCSLLKSITKLEILYAFLKSDRFQILCEELQCLEELTLFSLEDTSGDPSYNLSRKLGRRGPVFPDEGAEVFTCEDLRKLKRLRRLSIAFENPTIALFSSFEKYICDGRSNLDELSFITLDCDEQYMADLKEK